LPSSDSNGLNNWIEWSRGKVMRVFRLGHVRLAITPFTIDFIKSSTLCSLHCTKVIFFLIFCTFIDSFEVYVNNVSTNAVSTIFKEQTLFAQMWFAQKSRTIVKLVQDFFSWNSQPSIHPSIHPCVDSAMHMNHELKHEGV